MKKALIIGVEGFVGYYLAKVLEKENISIYGTYFGMEILPETLQSMLVKAFYVDITNQRYVEEVVKEVKPDYIFHLAAQSSAYYSWKNPQLTMSVNINGTVNVLEAIRKYRSECRMLLIGSADEYGTISERDIPVIETQPLRPTNPYAVSKVTQEMLANIYIEAYGLDVVMTRSYNHIGPAQRDAFVVSSFAKRIVQIERGLCEAKIFVGDTEVCRDFTDVRDVVNAYYLLIKKGEKGQVYNVGSNKKHKISDILCELINISGKQIEIVRDHNKYRPTDVKINQCDNTKLIKQTGWKPEIEMTESLNDILDFWRKKYNEFKR